MSWTTAVRRMALAAALCACVVSAQGHPGHGSLDQGIGHALQSPYHIAVLALTGGALFGASWLVKRAALGGAMRWGGLALLAASSALCILG